MGLRHVVGDGDAFTGDVQRKARRGGWSASEVLAVRISAETGSGNTTTRGATRSQELLRAERHRTARVHATLQGVGSFRDEETTARTQTNAASASSRYYVNVQRQRGASISRRGRGT